MQMPPQSMQASRHAATTIASISKEEVCSIGRWPYSVPLPEVYRDGEGRFSRTTIFSCTVLVRARPEVADRLLLTDVACCGPYLPQICSDGTQQFLVEMQVTPSVIPTVQTALCSVAFHARLLRVQQSKHSWPHTDRTVQGEITSVRCGPGQIEFKHGTNGCGTSGNQSL